ncbi:YbaY family lipoprotein [Erwinia sp. BNK-24-b]|uniref:YbaY family lipoprotein n=1 Tax=Erwinia TaxID=551 RepID=UPI001FEDCFD7|nr:YbaY family lipoprotein [Erwinia phyllosphaerae]MBV4366071.1 YbaY family lipoprotein [Erwinia phyllosphaerae]
MKFWPVLTGAALAVALSGCADKGRDVPTATLASKVAGESTTLRQPNVSGSVYIRQKIMLPPKASLTVTLSDASVANAPSKVISQRVVLTDGKQAPFRFILPFNPADIQPNARILLSAAVVVDGKVVMNTESVKTVITDGGTKQDLTLVPVVSTPLPTLPGPATTLPSTSPTQVSPSSSVPAPTSL